MRMGVSERGTGEKVKEAEWEFKVNSLRIIIPQTIRSVIRVYLLWRMRDYDSGAVVYKRGKIIRGDRKYVISPVTFQRGGNRVFRIFARAIGTKWRSEPGRTTECMNDREKERARERKSE